MASPPSSPSYLADRSYFKPTVTLFDWWLRKSQDNDGKPGLAVAGVSSFPDEKPERVFESWPISRRHDVFTLETIDGVTVLLRSMINKQQTIANGFSNEIATRFQLGFNRGWERDAAEFMAGDSNTAGGSGTMPESGSEEESPDEHFGSTSVHFDHVSPNRTVHCEDRLDVESPKQVSTNLPLNSTIDDSNVDDQVNHAPEANLGRENIGSTSEPATEALEILDEAFDTNAQTCENEGITEGSLNQFAGRVSLLFSGIRNRKGKKNQTVGNGLNSGLNTIDSVPAVSGSVRNPLENDSCETARNRKSHLSASEPQKSADVNVARILHFNSVEDDMEQISNAKEGLESESVTAEVRSGKSDAKGEIRSSRRNTRQVTVDRQENKSIADTNKKNNPTPFIVEEEKRRDRAPAENKKRKNSPSTPKMNTRKRHVSVSLEGSYTRSSTPSTVEVNNIGKVSLSTKLDTKKRKISPSTSKGRMNIRLSPPTTEVNGEKDAHTLLIPSESFSAGRSRSGRLRLRPLEFWRNQSTVYDKDHGLIGIQESVHRVTPARGSVSEPRKTKGKGG